LLIKNDILSTLAYFDIFSYPLTSREIYLFLSHTCKHKDFEAAINELLIDCLIYKASEFYSLHPGSLLTARRRDGNKKAKSMLIIANTVASLLSSFPFVRGIAVSGSLSKNYADEKSDIDLFIITAKNRLWIARTFMHLFKKLTFLVKKQDYFCMNYYIDEEMLQIQEKNLYTAIEIVTLLPLKGTRVFMDFYSANSWTKQFLPNNYMRVSSSTEIKFWWIRSTVEMLLNNKVGNLFDNILMRITTNRWAKKASAKKINNRGIIMSMHASKHFAKPDPKEFQQKLLALYHGKVRELIEQYKCYIKPAQ
jgi:predicted nucleotidyltransferase